MRFMEFLKQEEKRLVRELETKFSYLSWVELSKVLLCSVLVFNRKRVGDVDKIQVSCFRSRCDATPNSAIYESLNKAERIIAGSYTHFYTRGKKDSQVPIMLPKAQIPSVELLLRYRPLAGVSDTNVYLFGRGASSFFEGGIAMRQLTKKSNIENNHLLRSTALRKQIATMCQVMNMQSSDLDVLATYMGHSSDVHRRHYRYVHPLDDDLNTWHNLRTM